MLRSKSNAIIYSSLGSLSTLMVHSPTSAAMAPTAASTGANMAPTKPKDKGNDINSLPDLS
jgi:hypothetical protein